MRHDVLIEDLIDIKPYIKPIDLIIVIVLVLSLFAVLSYFIIDLSLTPSLPLPSFGS